MDADEVFARSNILFVSDYIQTWLICELVDNVIDSGKNI